MLPPLQAQEHNHQGDYDKAKSCGNFALFCNILSIVYFVLIIVAGVVALIVIAVTIQKR